MHRRYLNQYTVVLSLLVPCLATSAHSNAIDSQYRASVLEFEGELQQYRAADFNGDGRDDVLVILMPDEQDPSQSQDIKIFFQLDNGRFNNRPDKTIPLKKDILSFSYGDVRREPGQELVFYTREGAYSFSALQESYAGNIQRMVSWPLAQAYRDQFGIRFQEKLADFNGDGFADLLLPGESSYGIFYQSTTGFSDVNLLPVAEQANRGGRAQAQLGFTVREGLTFSTNDARSRTALTTPILAPSLPGETQAASEPLMVWESWQSATKAYDLEGDGRFEFVYLDSPDLEEGQQNKRRLNVFDEKAKVIQQLLIPATSVVEFVDWDGDGRQELVTRDHKEAGSAKLALYNDKNGQITPEPVQVMKFAGYEVEIAFVDIDNDDSNEMLVSFYGLSATGAVRGGNMLRTLLIYELENGEAGKQFQRRPSSKLDESFSSENFRGLTQRINVSEDVDGDGSLDALSIDSDGALIARRINEHYQVNTDPFWRFVPLHAVTWFQPMAINQDDIPDVVLSHQRSLTILVSQNQSGGSNE